MHRQQFGSLALAVANKICHKIRPHVPASLQKLMPLKRTVETSSGGWGREIYEMPPSSKSIRIRYESAGRKNKSTDLLRPRMRKLFPLRTGASSFSRGVDG